MRSSFDGADFFENKVLFDDHILILSRKELQLSGKSARQNQLCSTPVRLTKWETDQSAPSTANLFRLAEIFGTTVDLLLNSDEKATASPAEQIYYMYKLEQEQKRAEFKAKLKKNVIFALYIAAGYLLFFLIGRFIWCDRNYSFLAWLFSAPPSGEHSYLYGWLLSSNMFAISAVISVIPALFGKRIYPIATLCGFFVGFLAGFFFGPNPDGAALGMGHYGWAIWGVIFFASVIIGIGVEILKKRGLIKNPLTIQK